MKMIQTLCILLLSVLPFLYAYTGIFAVIGCFAFKHFPRAARCHRYAIVIAARNEASVIANLLASIRSQDYPQSCLTTFVVADNCTDNTAKIVRQNGAVCYERFDRSHQTKGFALQFLFRQIDRDYGIGHFDGYLLFDADNILKPDYIARMNDAFDSGEKIIASYRNTGNFGSGCIAASYAIHWMRTIRLEHRARSLLGLAGRLQGTGILFANELVKDGWNYTTLTEDRSFCADAVLCGYSISYQNEAEFFDEQPERLQVALRQRIRWAKGHLQSFFLYGPGLSRRIASVPNLKQKFMSFDMLMIMLPLPLICVILSLINILAAAASYILSPPAPVYPGQLSGVLTAFAAALFFSWLRQTAAAACVLFMERKRLPKISLLRLVWYCVTFFLFDLIGTVSMCIAAVTRVEWKPTPHYGARRPQKDAAPYGG